MKNLIIYLALSLCLFASKLAAQDSSNKGEQSQQTFVSRAKAIAEKIDKETKAEKTILKTEVEEINVQLEKGTITKEQAEMKKQELADARAVIIENKVNVARVELNDLIQEKVDGKLKENDSLKGRYSISFPSFKIKDRTKLSSGERRTTSQFVFAFGANNLVTNGAVANSDFSYLRSTFYEWGITSNYRLSKNSNLLHLKYGFSWMYNLLNATDNRYFVPAGNQTVFATYPTHLRTKDTYFKNVFVTIPMHLEFDFSKNKNDKDGNKIFNSHQGFRFGLGGFVGYNTNSKQYLSYEVDGYRVNERRKGDWNVDDFNYGLSAYVGWEETSLYLKYDLNPMFKDNVVKQNNISLGLRFDLN